MKVESEGRVCVTMMTLKAVRIGVVLTAECTRMGTLGVHEVRIQMLGGPRRRHALPANRAVVRRTRLADRLSLDDVTMRRAPIGCRCRTRDGISRLCNTLLRSRGARPLRIYALKHCDKTQQLYSVQSCIASAVGRCGWWRCHCRNLAEKGVQATTWRKQRMQNEGISAPRADSDDVSAPFYETTSRPFE